MNSNTKSTINTDTQKEQIDAMFFAANISSPVFICSLIFFVIAYAVDFIYFKGSTANIGEASAVSSILTGLGNIIKTAAFVLIAVGIGFKRGGMLTLPASLIGGIFSASGSTINSISGNLAGISGIFGCMLAGFTASFCVKSAKKYLFKNTETEAKRILCYILSGTACTFLILCTNEISQIINTYTTEVLGILADYKNILFPIIIGILIVIDGSGPLYLCAYLFGVSSVIAGKPQIMAAVMAAGMVAPLSISLSAFLFKDRFLKEEKITAYMGVVPALLGLPQAALPFYVSRRFRIILPCLAGSVVTSVLTVMLGCSTNAPMGGFLTTTRESKPLYILLCVIFGVMCSTALLALTIKESEQSKETEDINTPQKTTMQQKSHP